MSRPVAGLRATSMAVSTLLALAACGRGATAPAAHAPSIAPVPTAASSPPADAGSAAVPDPRAASDGDTPETAKPAFPSLKVDTFDGAHYDLAAHRGRWVVVNFWATWCAPCLKEIPGLAALDKARGDIDVIGLAYEEIERADMLAFLKRHPIPYPVAVLDVYAPPADFDTPRGLPMTYLIAPDGRVARTFLGPVEPAAIEAAVDGRRAAR